MRLRCIGAKSGEAAPRWRSRYVEGIVSGRLAVARMSIFAGRSGLALVLAALCLGGRTAHGQAAPVTYWIPSWPVGFSGNMTVGQSPNTYGNFPGLTAVTPEAAAFPIRATIFRAAGLSAAKAAGV